MLEMLEMLETIEGRRIRDVCGITERQEKSLTSDEVFIFEKLWKQFKIY